MKSVNLISPEAIAELKKSRYVANISPKVVRFTEEFKEIFWTKYRKGVAAELILEQLGIDPIWLGEARVAGIRQHIKKQARQIEGFKDHRLNRPGRAPESMSEDVFYERKRLRKLESEIAYMHQELEFIKKILLAKGEKK